MSRNWRPENLCRHCACNPCQCHTHEQKYAAGKERYQERTAPQPEPKKKAPKTKAKAKPKKSKAAFIKAYKKGHPTASKSDIKAALKNAGYKVGCGVIAILILSSPVGGVIWGGYEIISYIVG